MHGDRARSATLVDGIVAGLDTAASVEIVVCPPAVLIPHVLNRLAGASIGLGAQDLSEHQEGAYTGEISGAMLVDAGCRYCIVGHSERRALHGETNALVAAKFQSALDAGLTPILCVGETLEERDSGAMESVIAGQVDAVLDSAGAAALSQGIVAYEPVWAIGTGRTATPEQAQAAHAYIRQEIHGVDPKVAESLRILYGGSVKPDNARGLFSQPDIDGGLIGGASLNAEQFLAVCAACTTG